MPGAPLLSVNFAGMNLGQANFGSLFPELNAGVSANRNSQVFGLASFISILDCAVEMTPSAAATEREKSQHAVHAGQSPNAGVCEFSNMGPEFTALASHSNGRPKSKTVGPTTALMQMDGGLPGQIVAMVPIPQFDSEGNARSEAPLPEKFPAGSGSQLPASSVFRMDPKGSLISAAPIAFALQLQTKSPAPILMSVPVKSRSIEPTTAPLSIGPAEKGGSSSLEKTLIREEPVSLAKPVIPDERGHGDPSIASQIVASRVSTASSGPSAGNSLWADIDVELTNQPGPAVLSWDRQSVASAEGHSISSKAANPAATAQLTSHLQSGAGSDIVSPMPPRSFSSPRQIISPFPVSAVAAREPGSTTPFTEKSAPVSDAPPLAVQQRPLEDGKPDTPDWVQRPGASFVIGAGEDASTDPAEAHGFVSSPATGKEPLSGQGRDQEANVRFPSSSKFPGADEISRKPQQRESAASRNGTQGAGLAIAGRITTSDASASPSEMKESHTSLPADWDAVPTPRTETVDHKQPVWTEASRTVRGNQPAHPKNNDTPAPDSPRKNGMPRRNGSPSEPIEPAITIGRPAQQGITSATPGAFRADQDYGRENERPRDPARTVEDIHSEPALNSLSRNAVSRQISLKIGGPDSPNIALQLREQAGKIQIAVRSGDTQLNRSLQSDLGALVNRLENQGFKTEAWVPAGARHAAIAQAVPDSTTRQAEPDHSGFANPGQHRHESSHRNPRRHSRETAQFVQAICDEDARTEDK